MSIVFMLDMEAHFYFEKGYNLSEVLVIALHKIQALIRRIQCVYGMVGGMKIVI